MEKRIQQVVDSLVKGLLSLITLRPLARALFSFKGAILVVIAVTGFRIVDSLFSAFGSRGVLSALDLPSEILSFAYATINITYYVALIAVLVLLKHLLARHREDDCERALTLALRQGVISKHEFEQKRLLAQSSQISALLDRMESGGVIAQGARASLQRVIEDSHRRWALKAALAQALASGAIDSATHGKRVSELGLQEPSTA